MKKGCSTGIENGQLYILCHACNKKSFHPKDIENQYCGYCHAFHGGVLKLWTIYGNPADHRGKFVARLWLLDHATDTMFIGDTLGEVRGMLPSGLVCMPRDESDDPVIVETWL